MCDSLITQKYADGELNKAESMIFEEHLLGCRECALELEQLRRTRLLFQDLPMLLPSSDSTDMVMNLLAKQRRGWLGRLDGWFLRRPASELATLTAVMAMVLIFFIQPAFIQIQAVAEKKLTQTKVNRETVAGVITEAYVNAKKALVIGAEK